MIVGDLEVKNDVKCGDTERCFGCDSMEIMLE